jgi:hypothetical protein
MLRRLAVGAVFIGLGVMVAKSVPDVARYLKIRMM